MGAASNRRRTTRRSSLPAGVVDLTPARPPLDWKLAIRRYVREGWTLLQIAREAQYSPPAVRRGLLKRGVELRQRGVPDNRRRLLRTLWRGLLERAEGRTPTGRKLTLCRAWREFDVFEHFAARSRYRPGLALVRLDPERGYQPDNVRFVPFAQVNTYTRWAKQPRVMLPITAFGETKGLLAWARDPRCRVNATSLLGRLRGGLPPEAAISTPARMVRRAMLPHPELARARVRPVRDDARIARLYADGRTLAEIGRELGCARASVRLALRRAGSAPRPRSDLTTSREGAQLVQLLSTIRSRCTRPSDPSYRYIGAKGIRVGREWNEFAAFHRWALDAGWKPGLCLHRIDPRKGFNPRNCRFVTKREASQSISPPSRAKQPYISVTAFGETKGMTAWTRDPRCKVSATTFAQRLRRGMHPEDALSLPTGSRPTRGSRLLTAFGETKSLARWLRDRRCKVTAFGLRYRLEQGMAPELAITAAPWRARRSDGS